jgi:hypothetical protein
LSRTPFEKWESDPTLRRQPTMVTDKRRTITLKNSQ